MSASRDVRAWIEAQTRALRHTRNGDAETHRAIFNEWCVPPRTFPHWTDAMVWRWDAREVELLCESQRAFTKGER